MTTAAITKHWTELKKRGFDLGAAQGGEQDAGYGGHFQIYEKGRIYWHQTTGACEVHGRILERYIQAGGHDVNPATHERELGFPKSDTRATDDGRFGCVLFEWGMISDVSGTPLVRIFGRIYEVWRAEGGEFGRLGHPVSDVIRVEGGRAAWFERGVMWHPEGSRDVLIGELVPPTPGHPAFVDPENPGTLEWMRFDGATGLLSSHAGLAAAITRGRLSLVPVGGGGALDLNPAANTTTRAGKPWLGFTIQGTGGSGPGGHLPDVAVAADVAVMAMAPRARRAVPDVGDAIIHTATVATKFMPRHLYSLAFRTSGMAPRVISPHCLYSRNDWENFGLAHITDLHVSRRIEHYRAVLRDAGVSAPDIALLNNWNDAFRAFIRYANHLHDAGLLDVIIATGDLVDYVREVDDHPNGAGNFGFFEALLQGQVTSPDRESPKAEPLKVPVFTSLGNHDYRQLPYALAWDLKVTSGDLLGEIPLVGGLLKSLMDGVSFVLGKVPGLGVVQQADIVDIVSSFADTMWNHSGLNTTNEEALRLLGLTTDGKKYYVPRLRPASAAKAVQVEKTMRDGTHYYFRRLNPSRSYIIRLGTHRVVMLDTRWDEGITTDLSEAALTKLGFGSESQENFVGGQPDSVGINTDELALVKNALAEAGPQGMVVVGMHAPPVNPAKTDVSNCLRETAHPTTNPDEITGWLMRKDLIGMVGIPPKAGGAPGHDQRHPGWTRTGTPHFHEGAIEDLLDEGISVGQQEQFAQLVAGNGVARPVTLVVSGHGHARIEYRLRWEAATKKLLTFTDHYLANPAVYYRSYLIQGEWWKGDSHKRYLVRLQRGAPAAGEPQVIRDHRTGVLWPDISELRVPPYAKPLAEAADPAAWWKEHAPIVVQTAALGPCSNTRKNLDMNSSAPGPNFQGFRMIQFAKNVIAKVQYVPMADVLGGSYPLKWESGHDPVGPADPATPPPVGGGPVRETVRPDGTVVRDHRHG